MAFPSFGDLGYSGDAEDFGLDFGFSQPTVDALGYSGSPADFGLDAPTGFGRGFTSSDPDAPAEPDTDEPADESPPPLPVVRPPPEEENPPPRVNQPELEPLPVVDPPPEEVNPAPVVDSAVRDQAASDAQAEADAAADRRRRVALIRERQNPTGPRGLLTRPLVQRPRLLGH